MNYQYRCSICECVVDADNVAAHSRYERSKRTWPGVMEFTRVDLVAPGQKEGDDAR